MTTSRNLAEHADAQGEVISLLYAPDPAAGVVRVSTAAEHVAAVRRAVAAFDVIVERADQLILLE